MLAKNANGCDAPKDYVNCALIGLEAKYIIISQLELKYYLALDYDWVHNLSSNKTGN